MAFLHLKHLKKLRMKIHFHAVQTFFTEFCANSTIHGVRYFTESRRHWSERFWWFIAFSLSVWACGSSIQSIWMHWNERPVTMSFTEKEAPISAIPFPTVTICPETKASKDKLDVIAAYHAIRKNTMNVSFLQLSRMEAFVQTCQFHPQDTIHFGQTYINESIYDMIQDMAPSFNNTIDECEWQNEVYPCSQLFTSVLTPEGLCFAFNALNSREIYTDVMARGMLTVNNNPKVNSWTLENGYKAGVRDCDYPIRVFNARQSAVLVIQTKLYQRDLEYLCRGAVQGFKVILTAPGESIEMARDQLRVPPGEQADILIRPKLITTAQELRKYPPSQRKCYFSSERRLRFFRSYTQRTCETECLANYTKIHCGCVKFSMPRENTTKICGAGSVRCYQGARMKLYGEDIIEGLKDENARDFRTSCNCLPACASIEYDADIDRAKFDFMASMNSLKISTDKYSGTKLSLLSISFRSHHVMTLKRSALYTYTDFLAICGGLCGLFLGISVLSIIEFIYYSTLRLSCSIRHWRPENTVAPLRP